jgi:site-specific recombinase XerD
LARTATLLAVDKPLRQNKAFRDAGKDLGVIALPEPETDGHHTSSVEEIQKYIKRHPPGTKAYLVMMLLMMLFLPSGQRISDVAKLGKQHIRRADQVSELLRKTHSGRWLPLPSTKTLEQAELYTKKVRQQLMGGSSMHLIGFDQTVNECDPPAEGVAKSGLILG